MSERRLRADWLEAGPARKVMAALLQAGGEALFVGGCVRDGLAGRRVKDIDMTTDLPPDEVIASIERAGMRAVPTGLAHGTVTAVCDGLPVEITTYRRDVETDGRNATVAFTRDWREDAMRRDLTINALYCDGEGRIRDCVGGVEDLREGRVRFVGDPRTRMLEDRLRVLRWFRFQSEYGRARPDAETLEALRELAPTTAKLSGERLRAETLRILGSARAPEAWASMRGLGVLAAYLPEASTAGAKALSRIEGIEARLGYPRDPLRRLAAVLCEGQGEAAAERLRMSRGEREFLKAVVDGPAVKPDFLGRISEQTVRERVYRDGREVAVAKLMIAHPGPDDPSWDGAVRLAGSWRRPVFPLRGQDLIAAGLEPGPEVGKLMRAVEDWWVRNGFAAAREACLHRAVGQAVGREIGVSRAREDQHIL